MKNRNENIKIKSITGIRLPVKIIAEKTKTKKQERKKIKLLLFLKFKTTGIKKNKNILNLCRYEPAICSLPKGPESLYGCVFKFPKISTPNIN